MDSNAIRARINAQGWKLLEVPITKAGANKDERHIARWKVVAMRGDRSLEVGGATIDEALRTIGMTLGVIAKGS